MAEIMEKNELDYTCGLSDDELTERFKASIRIDEEIRETLIKSEIRLRRISGGGILRGFAPNPHADL